MSDYPERIGLRDVIAAWLVCLAIAGGFFIYPLLTAGAMEPTVAAKAASAPQVCTAGKLPLRALHG